MEPCSYRVAVLLRLGMEGVPVLVGAGPRTRHQAVRQDAKLPVAALTVAFSDSLSMEVLAELTELPIARLALQRVGTTVPPPDPASIRPAAG